MQWEFHRTSQRFCDFVRLIEATFDQAGFSQRYSDEDIRCFPVSTGLLHDGVVDQFAHQGGKRQLMGEFQLVNQKSEWRYIVGCHDGGIEGGMSGKTGSAQG